MTMKLFGNDDDAMLDLRTIETCGLIKGLDFMYPHYSLSFNFTAVFIKN